MEIKQLYDYFFKRLEKMYFSNEKKYDELGIILGEMDPYLFKDTQSADPALFDEFREKLLFFSKSNNVDFSLDVGKNAIKALLKDYNNKWGFDLVNVLKDIDKFI